MLKNGSLVRPLWTNITPCSTTPNTQTQEIHKLASALKTKTSLFSITNTITHLKTSPTSLGKQEINLIQLSVTESSNIPSQFHLQQMMQFQKPFKFWLLWTLSQILFTFHQELKMEKVRFKSIRLIFLE
jgi:hypothetical protein